MDSKTPAISPVAGSYLATLKTDGTLQGGGVLLVFLLELFGISARREGNGVVVTSGTTTALRVEEGGTTVGRDDEVAAEGTCYPCPRIP